MSITSHTDDNAIWRVIYEIQLFFHSKSIFLSKPKISTTTNWSHCLAVAWKSQLILHKCFYTCGTLMLTSIERENTTKPQRICIVTHLMRRRSISAIMFVFLVVMIMYVLNVGTKEWIVNKRWYCDNYDCTQMQSPHHSQWYRTNGNEHTWHASKVVSYVVWIVVSLTCVYNDDVIWLKVVQHKTLLADDFSVLSLNLIQRRWQRIIGFQLWHKIKSLHYYDKMIRRIKIPRKLLI